MKRKILCFTLAFSMLLQSSNLITVYANTNYTNSIVTNQPVYNKTIVCQAYDDDKYLKNVGISRGDYQIREVIPYTIKAGESITLWQTGGVGQEDITVQLKGDLAANEVNASISRDGTQVTLTAQEESVIYIKSPRTQFKDITISYSITNATSLPIFTQNYTNQAQFFDMWDTLGTRHAVIQNDAVILQIPVMNKDYLRNIHNYGSFSNVSHVLQYYKDMIKFYDYSYGLDNSESYNFNPIQKYLIVPDIRENNGIAGSYSTNQVRAYGANVGMAKMLEDSLVSKYLIAEGYQGDIMNNDVSLENVWNSIPAHYYAMATNSNSSNYPSEYLRSKPTNQRNIYDQSLEIQRRGGNGVYTPNFFREIFDEYGYDIFIKFNQEYRRLGMTDDHDNTTSTNLFVELFSQYANVDLGAYFVSFGHNVDQDIIDANVELPNVYYLYDLVYTQEKVDYIMARYGLESRYALVDTSIFAKDQFLNTVTGDAHITVDIDNRKELEGKQVLLKNGKTEYTAEIKNGSAIFEKIPVGTYNLYAPLTNSGDYEKINDKYINIDENGRAKATIEYKKLEDFYLNLDYDFVIRTNRNYTSMDAELSYVKDGIYDLKVNTYRDMINTETTGNELYGYIKVYDQNSRAVLSKELYNNADPITATTNTTLKDGYKIFLYRTGFDNKKFYRNALTEEEYYDNTSELMVFEVGDKGLVYVGGEDKTQDITDKFITESTEKYFTNKNQYMYSDKRIYLKNSINQLDSSIQQSYLTDNVQNTRLNNPVLSVGYSVIDVPLNQPLDVLAYATATDVEDGDISEKVTINSELINTDKLGLYHATFKVEDSDHNYDSKDVQIRVVNSYEVTTKPGGSDSDKDSNTSTSVYNTTITGRQPYPTKASNIETLYPEVSNRNQIVPFYYDEKNQRIIVKFSAYENGNVTFIDRNRGMYNYNVMPNVITFKDTTSTWGKNSIEFVASRGILSGVSETEFAPKTEVTRAMIVTVLGRLSDIDVSGYQNNYVDVSNTAWYRNHVAWASAEGILYGTDDTHYNPNGALTREQFAVVVVNYLKTLGYEVTVTNQNKFADDSKINEYAKQSVYMLREIGLVKGDTLNNYNPQGTLTREELSAILERIVKFSIDVEKSAK